MRREEKKELLQEIEGMIKEHGEDMARDAGGALWALDYLQKARHVLILDVVYD
jgi:hypothetical protein